MKIVTGKSLCGLSRPNGSFFLWGTYLPKIIFGRSQRSWRLTSSSLKPVPGRVEPQINRQTVFGGFESSFFPCLPFIHGRSGEAIETGFRRATLRQRSWSGRERATTHKKWKKRLWSHQLDEKARWERPPVIMCVNEKWKVEVSWIFPSLVTTHFFCWRKKFCWSRQPPRFLCQSFLMPLESLCQAFFYRVNSSLGTSQRL